MTLHHPPYRLRFGANEFADDHQGLPPTGVVRVGDGSSGKREIRFGASPCGKLPPHKREREQALLWSTASQPSPQFRERGRMAVLSRLLPNARECPRAHLSSKEQVGAA